MPSVIFIEPQYTDGPHIDLNDDHPPTGVAKGQAFLADIYASRGEAVATSVAESCVARDPNPAVGRSANDPWLLYRLGAFDAKDAPEWTAPLNDAKLVGRITKKSTPDGTTLYLHVFKWPTDGKLVVPGLKTEGQVGLLAHPGMHLGSEVGPNGLTISVPSQAPDKISSTVVLKLKGNL